MSVPQMPYGHVARSNWGDGPARAEYAIGDVVYVAAGCPAVVTGRCNPGLHRVNACFSIGEDASFYYRICPAEILGEKGRLRVWADWDSPSDRIHVFPAGPDYTAGWLRLYSAESAARGCVGAQVTA